MRLVLDHADDTVFGRRDLRIVRTSNHARVDVGSIERPTEQRASVAIVAHVVVYRGAFEVLRATGTGSDHVSATSVYNRHIKHVIIHC